jgi:UDP-2-acetamido-3-amino-2,3-dideoxy-glucuronate N-acetyltransferase
LPEPSGNVHATAIVEDGANIGVGTRIWHHAHVRAGAKVGRACNLGKNVFVDEGATVGDRVKIQNNVSLYSGVHLEDEVLVGPSAVFTNDRYPRAVSPDWTVSETTVRRGASIGANATIVAGVEIGHWAMVGAGAVVIKNIAAHELVAGNPARRLGWVCRCGHVIARGSGDLRPAVCDRCGQRVPSSID